MNDVHGVSGSTPFSRRSQKSTEGKTKYAKLNVLGSPSNQEIANNFGVMSTPTLMFLCRRRPVGQAVGLLSKEDLKRGLNDMLTTYKGCLSQSTELRPAYIV